MERRTRGNKSADVPIDEHAGMWCARADRGAGHSGQLNLGVQRVPGEEAVLG
jgi:hypothetical protein